MQFTITAAFLAALTAVSAAPSTRIPVTMMALRSASPIHFGSINASGNKFYIGVEPSSYCPSPPVTNCPSGNSTSLVFSGHKGGASLNVEVPGGQQVYIAPDNSLSYTQAHSASIPAGSTVTGFSLGRKEANGLRTISHTKGGFIACPKETNVGPWKIFVGSVTDATAPSGSAGDCLGFNNHGIDFTAEEFGAWQY